jgi:hypothetical protein
MAAVATALPKIESEPQKLVINTTNNTDRMIGVHGVERMRIYSNGNVGMSVTNPSNILILK